MSLDPYSLERDLEVTIEALKNVRQAIALVQNDRPELIPELREEERRYEERIRTLNAQLSALRAQSTGETVREGQAARDNGASVQSPPAAQPATSPDRVVDSQDTGTNAPTRSLKPTQAGQNLPAPGPVPPNSGAGRPGANAAEVGAAATDDAATGDNETRQLLRQLFGSTGTLEAKPNVLDQYASYTYSISIYLTSPTAYRRTLFSKQRNLAGNLLLMQSGGAPVTASSLTEIDSPGNTQTTTDVGASAASLGRNPYFKLDYYINDVKLVSMLQGKGTRAPHNVVNLSFKITEPNGITLLDNLYLAVQDFLKTDPGQPVNWAAQQYLMVIRFYGYDQFGNVIEPTSYKARSLTIVPYWKNGYRSSLPISNSA